MKRYIWKFAPMMMLWGSCGLDNYEAPKSMLSGQIMYKDTPIGLRGTGEAVQLQLYQDGYAFNGAIPVYVGQDGTFEAQLFDGAYKLVTRDNNGPWVNSRDTTVVQVKGATKVVLNVTPYYTLTDVAVSLNGTTLNYAFRINKVVEGANLDFAEVLLGTTSFVDDGTNVYRQPLTNPVAGNVLTATLDLTGNTTIQEAKALYARIGVRAQGVGEAIYSEIIKLR